MWDPVFNTQTINKKQNGEHDYCLLYLTIALSNMSDIKDILEIEQASSVAPTKEAIVGTNKV